MADQPTIDITLGLVKARLNRLPSDTSLDGYLTQRINAAKAELGRMGVKLVENDVDDTMLLADYAVWRYQNRDTPGGMPQWLKYALRCRWLSTKGRDAT